MEFNSDGVMIEGHICPNCKKLCSGIDDLQKHFGQCDSPNKVESWKKDMTNLFGKMKNVKNRIKTTVTDRVDRSGFTDTSSSSEVDVDVGVVTNVVGWTRFEGDGLQGTSTRLTNELLDARGTHIIRLSERTFTLVKNMHKLFDVLSKEKVSSQKKLKATEKSAVKWIDDKDVRYCRICRYGFGVKRWRHHCRVCGGIMCKRCSCNLGYKEAALVIFHKLRVRVPLPSPAPLGRGKKGSHHRHDDEEDGEGMESEGFLLCLECDHLIRKQIGMAREASKVPPPVIRLHERMLEIRGEINSLKPNYLRICESLLAGETSFTLDRAQVERIRIVKACESFDSVSKRILALSSAPRKAPIPPREDKLYRNIRSASAAFLQSHVLYLQPLPSPEDLLGMRRAREREREEAERLEAQRRRERKEAAERARRAAARTPKHPASAPPTLASLLHNGEEDWEEERTDSSAHQDPPPRGGGGDVAWVPESNPVIKEEHDPFLLQYQRLLGYIEQAHMANRLDEVEALEVSLRQIEREIIERKYNSADHPS